MRLQLRLLVVFVISLWCCAEVAAQSDYDPLAVLEQFPPCAQRCLLSTFTAGACKPTDLECICTNDTFQNTMTTCVRSNCTVIEALDTKNTSATNCNYPVRDRGDTYLKVSYSIISLVWLFIILRFAFKFYDHLSIDLDDWTILATGIVGTALTAVVIGGTIEHGLGKDIWTLPPEEITTMLFYYEIVAVLYFTTLTLLKLAIIFFYIKVFTSQGAKKILWGTAVFTGVWGTIYVIVAIFQCRPISYFWTHWDGLHEGTCLNINAITASNAGFSIVLDFWSLGIPLWYIRKLKLHWKKKIGVALMFGVGTFVTIMSILRLHSLVNYAKASNVSWEFYDVSIWSTVELGVGAICTCMPTIRLLFVKFFPVLGGSSNRSDPHRYKYGTENNGFRTIGRSTQPKRLGSHGETSRGSVITDHNDGIVVKSSCMVDHSRSDADEISLVEKNLSGVTESIELDDGPADRKR